MNMHNFVDFSNIFCYTLSIATMIAQSLWIGQELSTLEYMSIKSFLNHGYTYHLYTYTPVKYVPDGTIIKDANEILPESEIFYYKNGSPSAFSNIFRFTMLYKKGGMWVDTDLVCTKYFDFEASPTTSRYLFTTEPNKKYNENKLCAGIIILPKGDPIALDAMNICAERKDRILSGELIWGLGPATIKQIINKYSLQKYVKPWHFIMSCSCHHAEMLVDLTYKPHIEPPLETHPRPLFFNNIKDIPQSNHFIHLWNEMFSRKKIDKNDNYDSRTFYEQLKRQILKNDKQYQEFTMHKRFEASISDKVSTHKEIKQTESALDLLHSERRLKICFTMKPVNIAYGGGNQFLINLTTYLEKYHNIVYTLESNLDMIFVMDPRKLKYNHIINKDVVAYKKQYPNTRIIQRVNDCDKPRNQENIIDPIIINATKCADLTIFVSQWTCDYYHSKGYKGKHIVINGGCNQEIFYPRPTLTPKPPSLAPGGKVRLVTHHWSQNWNKGFDYFNKLNEYINTHPQFELTFIGRELPKEQHPPNMRRIGPLFGDELGEELSKHHIYITASKAEACPNHVLEGLSTMLPLLYHVDIGGGVEIAKPNGAESFSSFEDLLNKIHVIIDNYSQYQKLINIPRLGSKLCCMKYQQAIETTHLRPNTSDQPTLKSRTNITQKSPSHPQSHLPTPSQIPEPTILSPEPSIEIKPQKVNEALKKQLIDNRKNKQASILIDPKTYKQTPTWLLATLNWMKKIEDSDYQWSLEGYSKFQLGSVSLFAKLVKIYAHYYKGVNMKIRNKILKFRDAKTGLFKSVESEIIAETRQALSGLNNLEYGVKEFTLSELYPDHNNLFFMTDEKWRNPWAAGAQLSHYIFFCYHSNNYKHIIAVLDKLKKYEKPNGWYHGNPKPKQLINGLMKVITGLDVIGLTIEPSMAKNIIDYLIKNKETRGGCSIYDYVYVMIRCIEATKGLHRKETCDRVLQMLTMQILEHQMPDGGFKYDDQTEKASLYYGKNITPNGYIGSVHATTLFSMALALIDNYMGYGLKLNFASS